MPTNKFPGDFQRTFHRNEDMWPPKILEILSPVRREGSSPFPSHDGPEPFCNGGGLYYKMAAPRPPPRSPAPGSGPKAPGPPKILKNLSPVRREGSTPFSFTTERGQKSNGFGAENP